MIHVYTDGACSKNGQMGASGGIGVYFGPGDPRNQSCLLEGVQTNNRAELSAVKLAGEILSKEIADGNEICLHTDSRYVLLCCGSYGQRLHQKEWRVDKIVPNLDLLRQTYLLFHGRPNVRFCHIEAHTGLSDPHSLGNAEADLLAKRGSQKGEPKGGAKRGSQKGEPNARK